MDNLEQVRKSSRRSAWLTIYGALIIIGSLTYSYINLTSLENAISDKSKELTNLEKTTNKLKMEAESYRISLDGAKEKLISLQKTQDSVLDFLVSVTKKSKVHILDPSVNWSEAKKQLNFLPAGDRKNALLNAILLAWKDIPFEMGKEGVHGFDSPRFLKYVLQSVGVEVISKSGQRMSDALIQSFAKVEDPQLGDLVFFKGQVGSFGFILLSAGSTDTEHVGIGTLQEAAPLQIISMGDINTFNFPLKGYYRVVYPDEDQPKSMQPATKSGD